MMLQRKGRTDLLEIVQRVSELIKVCYVRQKEPLGLGHAILAARELVGTNRSPRCSADDILTDEIPALRQMMRVHETHRCSVMLVKRVPRAEVSRYGVIKARKIDERLYHIMDMVEKPEVDKAPSDLALIGRYILTPEIFPILAETASDRTGEIQLTNALKVLLKRKKQMIYALEFQDAGTTRGPCWDSSRRRWSSPCGVRTWPPGSGLPSGAEAGFCRDVFFGATCARGRPTPIWAEEGDCTVKDHETELPEPEGSEGQPEIEVGVEQPQGERKMPQDIPLLPVRDVVVYPFMILPLFVGRDKSIRAVDEALSRERLILLVAQRDAEAEDPTPEDVYDVGTVAMIMRMLKMPTVASRSSCRVSRALA